MPRGRPKTSRDTERACRQCGTKFVRPDWDPTEYCTRQCYYDSKRGVSAAWAKKPNPPIICPGCEKEFTRKFPSTPQKFCSRLCRDEARKRANWARVCPVCETHFESRAKSRRFCSQQCRGKYMRGVHASFFRGGYMESGGYKWVTVPEEERSSHNHPLQGGRYMQEHVYKVEKVMGRCLKRGLEVVHHINCNKLDNRNENLLVCTQPYHRYLHGEMSRRWAQEHL